MARHAADAAYGKRTLLSTTITTAVTGAVSDAVEGLAGVGAVLIEAIFTYGSGGTNATAWVQTRMPSGEWVDVACMQFTTATAKRAANLSGRTPVTTHYDITTALTAGQSKDGILGDAFRTKLTTTGTYADDTTLEINILPRGH